MSISTIALIAALATIPMSQDAEPRIETRSEIRIVTSGGSDGPGRLDADEDGFVTREEFVAPLANAFDRLDENDDGRLSSDEMPEGREGHHGPMVFNMREGGPGIMMFGGPDGRHGGPGGRAMVFGGRGGDENVFVFRRGSPGGDGEAHGPGEHRIEIRRFGGPDGPGDMDANDDGRVTEDEFLAPLREAFQRMDADRDGALDDGERGGSEGEE